MRSLGGFVLLAGIGVGLFVYLPTPVDNRTSLEQANRVSQEASQPASAPSRLTAFAPTVPLPTVSIRARNVGIPKPTLAVARPGDLPATTARKGGLNGWQTVVATNGGVEVTPTALQPTDPNSRYELVVELQKNLKRLGCYWGRIDGSWGPGSRDAIRTFTERVNAALPTEQPDYVLLTLLKGHTGRTCGEAPTVAQSSHSDSSAQVATAEPQALPWKATGQPVFKPIANSVISSAPLPGRMAIGGPKALPPVDQNYNAASPYTLQQNGNVATATLEPEPPPAAAPSATSRKKSSSSNYKRRHRRDGPGTPRYNLMLSLGGVY